MKEALKLALEALNVLLDEWTPARQAQLKGMDAVAAIKEALAQPEQEPVAYGMWDTMIGYGGRMMYVRLDKGQDGCTVPLYTTPPQRKPLTFSKLCEIESAITYADGHVSLVQFARAIEAAHGIK